MRWIMTSCVVVSVAAALWLYLSPPPAPSPAMPPPPTPSATRAAVSPQSTPSATPRTSTPSPTASTPAADVGSELDQDATAEESQAREELARQFVERWLDTDQDPQQWLAAVRELPISARLSEQLADVDPGNIRSGQVTGARVSDSSVASAVIDVTISAGTIRVHLVPAAQRWEVARYEPLY